MVMTSIRASIEDVIWLLVLANGLPSLQARLIGPGSYYKLFRQYSCILCLLVIYTIYFDCLPNVRKEGRRMLTNSKMKMNRDEDEMLRINF